MIAYVDANVILRFLLKDHPVMSEKTFQLMQAVESGDATLRIDEVTIAEVVWVLSSLVKHTRERVVIELLDFLSIDGVEVEDTVPAALVLFQSMNIDFVDALLASRLQKRGLPRVFSFDKHFDRIPRIQRLEPGTSLESAEG